MYKKQNFSEDARIAAVREYQENERKKQEALMKIQQVKEMRELEDKLENLTIQGKRIFELLLQMIVSNRGRPVSTARLAGQLGRRSGLNVWDRKLLDDLESKGLIEKRSQSLTSYVQENGKQKGRGRRFVYGMNHFQIDAIMRLKRQQQKNASEKRPVT
jgi:hypothetical protein